MTAPNFGGAAGWGGLRATHAALRDAEIRGDLPVGRAIERAVLRYGAPYLRPTSVRERAQAGHAEGAACSLRALLRYAAEESRSAAAAVAQAQAAS